MTNTPNSLPLSDLMRGPAAKFVDIGDKVSGRIVAVRREQQRSFESNLPEVWANGDPKLQTVIVLETPDGEVTLYARGGKTTPAVGEGQALEVAIVAAVVAAKRNTIDPGAELAVQHTGLSKPAREGYKPTKLFKASYRPAVDNVAVDDLFTS
jgi:hypothetical protein